MAKKVYATREDLPRAEMPTDPRFIDKTGKTYGRLTVLWFAGQRGEKKAWACECACGNFPIVRGSDLASGNTTSCGCYNNDQIAARSRTHGMKHTSLYRVWTGILARCNNPARPAYPRYGGRGIKVEFGSFEEFYKHVSAEIGDRPSPKHSIDRIDNYGNYAPGNLRWATGSEQCRNQRTNHLVIWEGIEMALSAACELAGLSYKTVLARINKYGWPPEKALSTPIRPIKRKQPC